MPNPTASNPVRVIEGTVTLDTAIPVDVDIVAQTVGDIAVAATDLDIRDLSAAQDDIAISDGVEIVEVNPDGSVNVALVSGQNGVVVDGMGDSASIDAFARLRTSDPFTIFDSKQIFDNQPLFWDDVEQSGSGTASSHSVDEAATTISVAATTAGKRIRQTFRRLNYQPGKSQLIFMTFSEFDTTSGITKDVGQIDDDNGLCLRSSGGVVSVIRRTNVTGTPVDNVVIQSNWNIDTMDGSGGSGVSVDFSKTQILIIDYEWLGVGRVRMGFVVDGIVIYCHQFLNANVLASVYMSTPNNPLRYSIENDGSGAADDFVVICSTVISEGGRQELGTLHYVSTAGTHVDANAANTIYALVGIRLKPTHLGATVQVTDVSILTETSDNFEWMVIWNPSVAGTFTYADVVNSAIQLATGATANVVTGGLIIAGGFASVSSGNAGSIAATVNTILALGASIAGALDEIILCGRPLSSNADLQGGINYRELS